MRISSRRARVLNYTTLSRAPLLSIPGVQQQQEARACLAEELQALQQEELGCLEVEQGQDRWGTRGCLEAAPRIALEEQEVLGCSGRFLLEGVAYSAEEIREARQVWAARIRSVQLLRALVVYLVVEQAPLALQVVVVGLI